MAARKTPSLSDAWRERIQTSMIINRLQDHIEGKVELSSTQVSAALGLLKKTAPDLSAVEYAGEVQHTYVARMPAPSNTMDEWRAQHSNALTSQNLQ